MFNPAKASDEIKKEYMGYISTRFKFKDPNLQKKMIEELDKTISNGPFVEIKDAFRTGKSIADLIDDGVISKKFADLEKNKQTHYKRKLPIDRPLYLHQEKAITKIIKGNNVVVSTGTGSGKTNCFLIPVIDDLLKEQEQGILTEGVRAIFIYPMNALANDQIKGLREILMAYPSITFGVYNGGVENKEEDAIKLYETMYANEKYPELHIRLPNERLSRDEIKKHPPHILFTNYAMLEHMLLRPGDDVIFSNASLKYVVLDEAHVYAGATGIETAFLMGRLKARINSKPQFILTSATLGDGSEESNKKVVSFAESLTGSYFNENNIIVAYREKFNEELLPQVYPHKLFIELANEENYLKSILDKYNIHYNKDYNENEILFDLLSQSELYLKMRNLGSMIEFEEFITKLGITKDTAVAFISLCAKARKNGKILIDIRYHYFLRALDGGYLALDDAQSFSLIRRDWYNDKRMFEIAVCDDCGEIAIIGKIRYGKLDRANAFDDEKLILQIEKSNLNIDDEAQKYEDDLEELVETPNTNVKNKSKKETTDKYILCKSCGAIVEQGEHHNKWCDCGNNQPIYLIKRHKEHCQTCGGNIRRFELGNEAATGVIATSLYEHIPEYSFEGEDQQKVSINPFTKKPVIDVKKKKKTGSQFLIFSDSRQGAAKFACFIEDSYKEFLRRRGIWNVVQKEESNYIEGFRFNDLVNLLENYFSTTKLFRKSNSQNDNEPLISESRRNAWVALLNELFNSYRATSLVSLGKLSFEYLGNSNDVIQGVASNYNISESDAKNFLNYLAFEVVKSGAILTDNDNDINDVDRKYLYFTQMQQSITKEKDGNNKNSRAWMPTCGHKKDGNIFYYRNNKLLKTKQVLNLDDKEAVKFLDDYWTYVLTSKDNEFSLISKDGKTYFLKAKSFNVSIGSQAKLWKCGKCGKVTQFNISEKCIQIECNGKLERLNSEEYCKSDYYAMLYMSDRIAPLFVKEHTAQLGKKEALAYQQQFIRKEINALSCSTTFEMGVDVGDLETVFLRNFPPLPSNYAQRVGRAGRSIDAAAFALTYARLSSHDFTFFYDPEKMISGTIYPPSFTLENEKILKRHIYAVAISLFLKNNSEQYNGNKATEFINNKGYVKFIDWLNSKPEELLVLLKKSFSNIDAKRFGINDFSWTKDFCADDEQNKGLLIKIIRDFENNIKYLGDEYNKAYKAKDTALAETFRKKKERYEQNEFIDFLVRGNILPKYGFPIDSVELQQNFSSTVFKTLNLSRDLAVAIAEYAPSSEVIADGKLYTSRYIRKPFVNHKQFDEFEITYIAQCPECKNTNYRKMPLGFNENVACFCCSNPLNKLDFRKSIEPRQGFIAEKEVKDVPLSSQERNYKTEAIYIGDTTAYPIDKKEFDCGKLKIIIESTGNDSLVVKSTSNFYVCKRCGYSIADDEHSKLSGFKDYKHNCATVKDGPSHENPIGKGLCNNSELERYSLHHEFKTDVAKITFNCDTSDLDTMLSAMYALLSSFAATLSIERRDIKACLTYKKNDLGKMSHQIIIYDSVPGGAGHSRRLVTENGEVFKMVIDNALKILKSHNCQPSCYRCLRTYENQKIHDNLNREKAIAFLSQATE